MGVLVQLSTEDAETLFGTGEVVHITKRRRVKFLPGVVVSDTHGMTSRQLLQHACNKSVRSPEWRLAQSERLKAHWAKRKANA